MGKIILNLPGNAFHSNLLADRWEEMFQSKVGLDAIGVSGVPVAISYQGIDYKIMPWLAETLAKYPSIEVLNAPHSHALIPLQTEEMEKWEMKDIIPGSIPMTFFPEFYAPTERFIPTEFFWVLEGASYLYSACCENSEDVTVETLPNAPAIQHGSKIGVIMRDADFGPILKAFFRFQRDPLTISEDTNGKLPLDNVLDEIERVSQMPDDTIIIVPIDIEAPFIGSAWGAKIWEMFFQGIVDRGLKDVFIPLSTALDTFRAKAVKSRRPHRILTKWTSYEVQVRYLMRVAGLTTNNETDDDMILASIASCSDILSAWERKIAEGKKAIILAGKNRQGDNVELPVSYNQDIITVQSAALRALSEGIEFNVALMKILSAENRRVDSRFIRQLLQAIGKNKS